MDFNSCSVGKNPIFARLQFNEQFLEKIGTNCPEQGYSPIFENKNSALIKFMGFEFLNNNGFIHTETM